MRVYLSLLLVSFSVGMSNFAGAIGIGLAGIDRATRLRVGVAFGLFEALMPVIGLLIGRQLTAELGSYSAYVGGGLLAVTGVYTILEGRREHELAEHGTMSMRALLVTAFALSIDNLVIGFALGVYPVPIAIAAVMMGAVSIVLSLAGLELGSRLGLRVGAWSEELGGVVLILVGLALAFGVFR
jgi:putative Mn2+ efflux pump MntP